MGRHAEAEPLYKQATEIHREALGEQHPDYATSLNNLASLYDAMGRHAEAESLRRQNWGHNIPYDPKGGAKGPGRVLFPPRFRAKL
jgi:uncharacterized protein HemY